MEVEKWCCGGHGGFASRVGNPAVGSCAATKKHSLKRLRNSDQPSRLRA